MNFYKLKCFLASRQQAKLGLEYRLGEIYQDQSWDTKRTLESPLEPKLSHKKTLLIIKFFHVAFTAQTLQYQTFTLLSTVIKPCDLYDLRVNCCIRISKNYKKYVLQLK